jgi:UPF0288 family protein (methanogenesis marker protein 3)
MKNSDYSCSYTVQQTQKEVFNAICNVKGWWEINTEGNTTKPEDKFTVRFGKTYVDFKVVEWVPEKKIAWGVTDCWLEGFKDEKEWNNTQVNFEIETAGDGSNIRMTHIGLNPEVYCYENCKKGWDFYAGVSLKQLIETGKGQPNTPQKER